LGPGGKQTGIDKNLAGLIQSYLNPYLGKVNIDMAGAVKGLRNLMPLFVKDQDRERFGSWLGTLRLGGVEMKEGAMILDVLMDVDAPTAAGDEQGTSLPATGIQALVKAWEDWDAFLVYQIQALAGQSVTEDEKSSLLEALLDRRYRVCTGARRRHCKSGPHPAAVHGDLADAWLHIQEISVDTIIRLAGKLPIIYSDG